MNLKSTAVSFSAFVLPKPLTMDVMQEACLRMLNRKEARAHIQSHYQCFSQAFILIALRFVMVGAVTVVSPSKDLTVVAGRAFTVEWINFGDNTEYAIDLFHRNDTAGQRSGACGTFVSTLCEHDDRCVDSAGDYDMIFPSLMQNMPSSGFLVGVMEEKDGVYGCSQEFRIVSEEVPPT